MFDIIISGGEIIDGTGSPAIQTDLGIVGETIEAIEDLSQAQSHQIIDAQGLSVAPGFIDTHTHSEGILLIDPQHANGLLQGITTEIVGLDGMSFAPLSKENYHIYASYLGGLLGNPPLELDMSSISAFRSHYHRRVAVNLAYLVPHGAIRLEILGFNDLPLVGESLKTAQKILREGLDQGAVGFSTGAIYYPGHWATTDELIEMCQTVKEAGSIYVNEPRVGNPRRAFKQGGILEGLEIAKRSGVSIHFAHLKTGIETAGKTEELMSPVDKAKIQGVDCSMDIYPYPTGSSTPVSFLPSTIQEGGPYAIIDRLRKSSHQKTILEFLKTQSFAKLDQIIFSYLSKRKDLEGKRLTAISKERGKCPEQTLCDLLLEEELKIGYVNAPPQNQVLLDCINQDCMKLLARPDYMVCSDITPMGRWQHPRCYGAFPRFLGRLRRNSQFLSLEEVVNRMTDNPARRFKLTKRGKLAKGYFADIVIFDPDRVIDKSTYENPRQFPQGITFVLVNGQVAVKQGNCTGILAGQAVP